jgi:DNA-binding MarR family transcriptional regulator
MRTAQDPAGARRIETCRWLLGIWQVYRKVCGACRAPVARAATDYPDFVILLELYLAGLEHRSVCQSALAPTLATSSLHRQAARLEQAGAILRTPDTRDQRRIIIVLAPGMEAAIERFIDLVEVSLQQSFERLGAPGEAEPMVHRNAVRS